MPSPRRRLSTAERRGRIVEAAKRCFARHGFSGTTTRALARAAGVSEALVYRHFPTKRSLYRAIVAKKLEEPSAGLQPSEEAARADDRGVLSSIAMTLISRIEADPSFMRLLMFSALERNPLARMFFEKRSRSVVEFLTEYLEQRMKQGALRVAEPEASARAFLGMVVHHLQLKHLMRLPVSRLETGRLVDLWVGIFLGGLGRCER